MPSPPLPQLEPYRVVTPIAAAYVLPDFVSAVDESYLLRKLEELGGSETTGSTESKIHYRTRGTAGGWREVRGRRAMYLGGQLLQHTDVLVPVPMPAFLQSAYPAILQRVAKETGAFDATRARAPNHVLVNEYMPGQGIHPHEDGAAYFPAVATLSLGSHTILDIYAYEQDVDEGVGGRAVTSTPCLCIFLPRRSLFVMTGEMYTSHLHGIAERRADNMDQLRTCANADDALGSLILGTTVLERQRRVSLTMRHVQRVRRMI